MLTAVLALGSAIVYGTADFLGGLASRRNAVGAVIVTSQTAGLIALLVAVALTGGRPDAASLAWGAAAGLAGAGALSLFYRALAAGTMSVVAPLTALGAAALPVLAGLVFGERPGPAALLGVAAALVAVVLVSAETGRLPSTAELRSSPQTGVALIAGAGFGLLFVLLSRAGVDSGLWPLLSARVVSVTVVLVAASLARRGLLPVRADLGVTVLAGVADMAANVLFLLASRTGSLVVSGVLSSLYPATTVLLALAVLRERLHRIQTVGLGVAVLAVVAIALG